jgi:sortase (surface protein transpeptidase)
MATGNHGKWRSWPVLVLDVVAVGLALAGLAGLAFARVAAGGPPPVRVSGTLRAPTSAPPTLPPSISPSPSAQPTPTTQPTVAAPVAHAAPVALSIPAIDVRTPLIRLGLNPDGTLEVPTGFSVAGWYDLGPRPGDRGAAVIVGHVDSTAGPAVFYRLGELAPGDIVRVQLADRTEVWFRVYAVREYVKAAFPTSLVYGATPKPELRLVTCGGPFDASTAHYLDNIVVFAR